MIQRKVAILSQSMPDWSVAFFATAAFGRISIPILPDSSENEVTNKSVNKSSQVSSVEVMKEPFEKTATQKIRRFKYKESAPTVEEEQRNK